MKQATVIMPMVGEVAVYVDLEDDATDQDAIAAAWEVVDLNIKGANEATEPMEFEILDTVTQGNVNMFSSTNSIVVEWE